MDDLYQELIIEESRSPQNFGLMANADLTLEERNASCGDEITIYLKLDPEKKRIIDIKWQGQGCVISQAAMSVLSGLIKEKNPTLAEVEYITQSHVEEKLHIRDMSIGRIKCLTLGLKALSLLKK